MSEVIYMPELYVVEAFDSLGRFVFIFGGDHTFHVNDLHHRVVDELRDFFGVVVPNRELVRFESRFPDRHAKESPNVNKNIHGPSLTTELLYLRHHRVASSLLPRSWLQQRPS